ncbi:SAM-dependent methyltransferase [Cephaloticoccus capnophilus]|uniref:SAM-dependent methyltransferase n=1 Tax=Cephaloticoccus capnophilus TaxID=1548208 RepID=A0A139SQA0_9BACT|nr:class I SAM-dependent methyltransferase [Cephaloticoccus capnophilus]KXU36717.1 SAM-dependent methyltransferase [Cephaloticoccus capnophilus]
MTSPASLPIQTADHWQDYQLLDCADGMKREQWGPYSLLRPDPQIIWGRAPLSPPPENAREPLPHAIYHRSDKGGGHWEIRQKLPESWTLAYAPLGLRFKIRPTNFKHTGLFPEQAVNWEWASALIKAALSKNGSAPRPRVLNLFAYTGAATCAAAKAGAEVAHVDAAEGMVKWARENATLSGLAEAPIRYLCDDCLKFVRRENRRGRRYDAIIMDPPSYGRGSGGQMWKLETHLWPLLQECRALLSDTPLFFLINAYTAQLSPTVLANLLGELFAAQPDCTISAGELGLPIQADGKTLPCGIFGRAQWTRTKE